MGLESDLIESALLDRESSDFGGTFTYGGKDYPCCIGRTAFGGRLVSGGISANTENTITLRKSLLDFSFKVGQEAKLKDSRGKCRNLKIAKDGIVDCVFAWELTLDDQNQNA